MSPYPALLFVVPLPAPGIWEIYLLITCSSLPMPTCRTPAPWQQGLFGSLRYPQHLEQWVCVYEWKGSSPRVEAGVQRAFQVERPGNMRQDRALSIQLERKKAGSWEEHKMAKIARHFYINVTSLGNESTARAYLESKRTNNVGATRWKKLIKRNKHSAMLVSLPPWGNLLCQFWVGMIIFVTSLSPQERSVN